jgi:hypothetical protein
VLGVDINQGHVDPLERRLLGDLSPHGARADDQEATLVTAAWH